MSDVPTTIPKAALSGRRRWRRLLVCSSAGLLVLLAASAGWRWYRASLPQPPVVDTSDREPEIGAAIQEARHTVLQRPWSGAAWGQLGMVLLANDYQPEARECLAEAGRLDPREPRWPYLEGRLVQQRDPEGALPLMRRAVGLAGVPSASRLYLAETLLGLDRPEEAEAELRRVLHDEPSNPRAHLDLGRLAYDRGELDASLDHLRRAAAGVPNVQAPHALLAQVYHRRGDTQAEERELALLAECDEDLAWPDPYMLEMERHEAGSGARVAHAQDLVRQGRNEEAVAVLQEAVRTAPEAYQPRMSLGYELNRLGDPEGAEPQLRAALRLRPDSFRALSELGLVLQRRGKFGEAAQCYERVIALQPGHALAYFSLANCREQQGDRAGAIDALRAALRVKPEFALGHKTLGRLLAEGNQNAEAVQQLQDALRLNPDDAKTKELLDKVRARLPRPGAEKEK